MRTDEVMRLKKERGSFADFDLEFGKYLLRLADCDSPELMLAGALVCRSLRNGDTFCRFKDISQIPLPLNDGVSFITTPDSAKWQQILSKFPAAVSFTPDDSGTTPLIADNNSRLMLRKYFDCEKYVFNRLTEMCKTAKEITLPYDFPASDPDLQDLATVTALSSRLTILSGGPGTGKTTVSGRILKNILFFAAAGKQKEKIILAAPTGKAQQRLSAQLAENAAALDDADPVKLQLKNLQCSTIDALLLNRELRTSLNDCTLLLVDECSMIPLVQFDKLLRAIENSSPRLVLVGDRRQLPPVGSGSVFADICAMGNANVVNDSGLAERFAGTPGICHAASGNRFDGNIVELLVNHRSKNAPAICRTAEKLRDVSSQDAKALCHEIAALQEKDFTTSNITPGARDAALKHLLERKLDEKYSFLDLPALAASGDEQLIAKALETADKFKILCAVNDGPTGAGELNEAVCRLLGLPSNSPGMWKPGTLLLITANDRNSPLRNGDSGLVVTDPVSRQLSVRFANHERSYKLSELPEHKCGFAMTVHKAQGSGFANVLLTLPEYASPVLSCELLYTGITRASQRLDLWASEAALLNCFTGPKR